MEKTKTDQTVSIWMRWNNRKITAKEAMLEIGKVHKEYIESELNPSKKEVLYCKFCKKRLSGNKITYCNRDCYKNHRAELRKDKKN